MVAELLSVVDNDEAMENQVEEVDQDGEDEAWHQARARVPNADQFGSDEFMSAPALERLAEKLIDKHDMDASYFDIAVLWKRKGGTSQGQPTLGKTAKISGLTQYFSEGIQFVIWLAADHVDDLEFTNYQLEALLARELMHIGARTDDDGSVNPVLVGYDFAGFSENVQQYGNWNAELRKASKVFEQAKLPGIGLVN